MGGSKKITVNIPEQILREAQMVSGRGVTDTIILGLEELRKQGLRSRMLKLKGAINFDLILAKTRR